MWRPARTPDRAENLLLFWLSKTRFNFIMLTKSADGFAQQINTGVVHHLSNHNDHISADIKSDRVHQIFLEVIKHPHRCQSRYFTVPCPTVLNSLLLPQNSFPPESFSVVTLQLKKFHFSFSTHKLKNDVWLLLLFERNIVAGSWRNTFFTEEADDLLLRSLQFTSAPPSLSPAMICACRCDEFSPDNTSSSILVSFSSSIVVFFDQSLQLSHFLS